VLLERLSRGVDSEPDADLAALSFRIADSLRETLK
jgi:hypothetical protein